MVGLFEEAQELIFRQKPEYSSFLLKVLQQKKKLDGIERVKVAAIERLFMILRDFPEERSGLSELALALRQVIRLHARNLFIPTSLWMLLEVRAPDFHLWGVVDMAGNVVELHADDWRPEWLADGKDIDCIEMRRADESIPGDGLLFAATGKTRYLSQAQKDAVEACFHLPPGATLLVSLPTGSGKSHCILLPAWFDSHGGRKPGGTALVIVPTVALALDQERRANEYFPQAYNEEYRPWSLTGSTLPQNRFFIREGLRKGTLPLLFTSPESVLDTEIYDICMDAARRGHLRRVVIDEAHIIESWGAGFRAEFQFLATFRKNLMQVAPQKPTTILLSATVSRYCSNLLRTLFSEGDQFVHLSANRLRPEIAYWFSRVPDRDKRDKQVQEALYHLPRPAILYVNRPDEAEGWVERLRQQGFRRIAAFSGNTDPRERERILNEWNRDNLDMIVATSAFGLGVDKADVRTVIHAALPENLDRFYQEVGRGGRDGMSSISLLCTTDRDYERTFDTIKRSRITVEKALERWEGMLSNKVFTTNREMVLDLNAVPTLRPELRPGELHRDWNTHILLMMQRAELIDILDTRIEKQSKRTNDSQQAEPAEPSFKMLVRIKDVQVTNDLNKLRHTLEAVRTKEARAIREGLRDVDQVANQYAAHPNLCFGFRLMQLYEHTGLACGGCPACRAEHRRPYTNLLNDNFDNPLADEDTETLDPDLQNRLLIHQTLNLFWSGTPSPTYLKEKIQLFVLLVKLGIRQIILPEELFSDRSWSNRLIEALGENDEILHRVISLRSSPDRGFNQLLPFPTVVVYGTNNREVDETYQTIQMYRKQKFNSLPVINILYRDLNLSCESGTFLNRVNGQNDRIDNFERNFMAKEDTIEF